MSESSLLRRFMRAAFLEKPAACSRVRETWDVTQMLDHLKSLGPIESLPVRSLTHRTFALLLIYSCWRISNLMCLSVDPAFCSVSNNSLTLQFGPGLKQDRINHMCPPIQLEQALDEALCPVHHLTAYLAANEHLLSTQSLFIPTIPPHRVAAR